MLLASIGLYGLASYGVAQRIPEIGVRMALGARREDVARMVIRETLGVAALGVIAGVAAALAAGRLIQGLLFGLAATDAPTIAMASASMGAVTLLAAYLPARRAARVDPMIALRHE
jgi:putative ABC transport system permease protein